MSPTPGSIESDVRSLAEEVDAKGAVEIGAGNYVLTERAVRVLIQAVTELTALQKQTSDRIDAVAHFAADPLDYVESRFEEACARMEHAYFGPTKNLGVMPGATYEYVEWRTGLGRRLRLSFDRRGVLTIDSIWDSLRVASTPAFAATLDDDALRALWTWLHDYPRTAP